MPYLFEAITGFVLGLISLWVSDKFYKPNAQAVSSSKIDRFFSVLCIPLGLFGLFLCYIQYDKSELSSFLYVLFFLGLFIAFLDYFFQSYSIVNYDKKTIEVITVFGRKSYQVKNLLSIHDSKIFNRSFIKFKNGKVTISNRLNGSLRLIRFLEKQL